METVLYCGSSTRERKGLESSAPQRSLSREALGLQKTGELHWEFALIAGFGRRQARLPPRLQSELLSYSFFCLDCGRELSATGLIASLEKMGQAPS